MIAGATTMPIPSSAAAARSASHSRDTAAASASASASAERPAAPVAATAPVTEPGRHAHDKAADAEGREPDFDALLSDAGAPAASVGLPIAIVPPSAVGMATVPAEPAAEPLSPDHLLALLDGRWAQSTPPPSAAIAAPPVASAPVTVTSGIPLPTAGVAGTAAAVAALSMPGVLEGREADLAGRMAESAESTLMRETASTEPAALTAPTASSANGAARSPSLVQTTPIPLPADPDAGFDDAFGSRIAWMAEQRMGHAEIRVTPDHAGPIDVRLQLDGTRVSADFQSTSPEVRQALEASMARLREMLEQQGLQLAHAGVGNGDSGRRGAPDMGHGHDPSREAELDPRLSAAPIIRSTRGLLDEYA